MFILKILCCTELRDPYFYVYIDIIIKEAYMYIILACQFWRGCEGETQNTRIIIIGGLQLRPESRWEGNCNIVFEKY